MGPSSKPEFPPLLPPGFHLMEQEGLAGLCVRRFPLSSSRGRIMAGLQEVLTRLASAGVNCEVWVNGSFLTERMDPDDVDFAIRLWGPGFDAASLDVVEAVEWAISDLKASHRVDGYVWAEWPGGHSEHAFGEGRRSYWTKWYGTSRSGQSKGIVVIRVGAGVP